MKAVLNGREAQVFDGLDRDQLLGVYRCMLLSRRLDDKEIQAVVDKVNEKFANVEQVKKFRILDHDLTIESGDLTPSMKVKRSVVYDTYADVFASMYDEN